MSGFAGVNGPQGSASNMEELTYQICFKTGILLTFDGTDLQKIMFLFEGVLVKAKDQDLPILLTLIALILIKTMMIMTASVTQHHQTFIPLLESTITPVWMHMLLEQFIWLIWKELLMMAGI